MAKILRIDRLDEMLKKLTAEGVEAFGPVRQGEYSFYGRLRGAEESALDLQLPAGALKALFFPRSDPYLTFEIRKQRVKMETVSVADRERVVFGSRPCDAAGLTICDHVFGWDCRDEDWFSRRERTTIVSVVCTTADEFCLCTSLNRSPDSAEGSDVLLWPLADERGWRIEAVGEKGRAFVERIGDFLEESEAAVKPAAQVPERFDFEKVVEWLKESENFDSPLWEQVSRRCIGCGTCTYLCPTCHCFDIQDEGDAYRGVRRKNWDSCSFGQFTVHTSGHNPRSTQAARWRQRIMHKFNYYVEKFGVVGCSGCGRCVRDCPADMGIVETLQRISEEVGSER